MVQKLKLLMFLAEFSNLRQERIKDYVACTKVDQSRSLFLPIPLTTSRHPAKGGWSHFNCVLYVHLQPKGKCFNC